MKIIKAKVTRIYKLTKYATSNVIVNEGGTRSGKSYALCQLFIEKLFTEPNKKLLICRKYANTLRYSTYQTFIEILIKYKLYDPVLENKTLKTYYAPNTGSTVWFLGLDEFEKLKSTEFNYIWMEEATEFDFNDFIVLYDHLSAPSLDGKDNKIYLTFNPDYPDTHWINTELPKFNPEWIKSNYKDNPFLSKTYIKQLEHLKNVDDDLYRVYVLGERAELKNRVFQDFLIIPQPEGKLISYGLDFGYNDPTAIVAVYVGDDFWCFDELFYESYATIEEIAQFIKFNLDKNVKIFADPSRPDLIEFLQNKGIWIDKAKSDVLMGINLMKSKIIKVTKTSSNLIKELKQYKWKEKGGIILDEVVSIFDHAIDAARYGLYSAWRSGEIVSPIVINKNLIRRSRWR